MSLPNIAEVPFGPVKEVLKLMIVHFVGKKRLATDQEIHVALNSFMSLSLSDMNRLLRELVGEKKIGAVNFKVPLKVAGNYGHMAVYTFPETEAA